MLQKIPMSGSLSSAGFFLFLRDNQNTIMSIKSTIAAVAASPFLLAGAAFAGPYVNVESNLTYPDGDYSSAATDFHIGYEGTVSEGKIAYFVQGGPSLNHSESTDDTETELSGKVGASYGVSEDLALYGEVSGASNGEDSDGDNIIDWGAKIGAKFTF
tara:strand:- start:1300 stop:1773 length:474 start_codon:yes stop_codon:yes gene_type:complete